MLLVNSKYGTALIHAPDTLDYDTGEILGQVVDISTKYGIEGATVTLDESYSTTTLPNGWYRIPGVDTGVRFIDGAKNGYLGDFDRVLVEPIFVVQAPTLELKVSNPGYIKITNDTGYLAEVAIYGQGNVLIEKDDTLSWELPAGNYQLTAWKIICLKVEQVDFSLEAGETVDIALSCDAPINNPPNPPSNPSPLTGTTNQDLNVDLSWIGGDLDGDNVTYDVYFEAGNPAPSILVSDDQTVETNDPGTLLPNTHYYWQIIAKDEHGAITAGPVWDFITGDGGTIPEEWITKFRGYAVDINFPVTDNCEYTIAVNEILLGPTLPSSIRFGVSYWGACTEHVVDVDIGNHVEVYGKFNSIYNSVSVCSDDYYMVPIP